MVSSPSLAREIHSHLQSRVQEYMQQEGQNHSDGQRALGVFDIVTWITELLPSIAEMADAAEIEKRIEREVDTKAGGEEDKYVRQWMFFHHVYSKTKRIDIVAWAKELGLNGFLKSGKPGVVCLEGNDSAVREMLVIMGGWNWQIIKRKECHVISNSMESTGLQACFSGEGFLELKERDCGLVLEWLNTKSLGTEFMATLGLSYVP
ncbi:hypothetical protein SARC_07137 [Sphaeroforma arctica JP610]|uniref:Small nuclear ribonucleoprotein Prp3 C-terminal domain-containing protein n=1 Tax=Sphaeroforma arctica JP610 TaxID=667725 RepID=A0A0L0FUG3_9EUKA|nr:hypothetical protein SARC_07137 [Sphaeroforma arctica JP610]KNC80495.1 hypothetical protein SARC_07137 [Sphaeroforma arctica JP610]|eukprot:XP_014154397.1 hypothetical protein SARC_07137 [Sphaeroforma arctica JP610]